MPLTFFVTSICHLIINDSRSPFPRRRVEKANSKVLLIESKFEYELDELITKQKDQSVDLHYRIEDKLKYHLIDVVFIEQCQRWLTNTQVKIRGVVAKCNSQASDVRISTDKLRDCLVATSSTSSTATSDEENLNEIKENFEFVMKLLQDRTDLLSCRKDSGKEIEELASLKNAAVSNRYPSNRQRESEKQSSTNNFDENEEDSGNKSNSVSKGPFFINFFQIFLSFFSKKSSKKRPNVNFKRKCSKLKI